MKDIYTLRTSILSALAIANVTVIGYAISSRTAIIFLLGCLITGVGLIMESVISKLYISVLYQGMWLTERYSQEKESLFSTIISTTQKEDFRKRVSEICTISDSEERRIEFVKLAKNITRLTTERNLIIMVIWAGALLVQFLAVPILYLFAGWQLF